MAELFLAEDSRSKKHVVIKRILPYLVSEPEFVQMFLDEARIAAQLHHPNVVEVNELGKLGEHIFIAMELVDGIDLRRILQQEQKRQSTVAYPVAAYIVARICDGLHYAHNRVGIDGKALNLIHRDISPQNVMVSYDGEVKLVDFGIAKASAVVERSKPGVIKGKYLYLAPEQLTQEKLDHRADLFAIGTMLYEITTGKSPFAKSTTEAVILAIRNEEPPPPHLVRPDFPLELSRIITKCLQKDRNRRYQQAGEIAEELDDYVSQSLSMTNDSLASYIARLFGTDDDRTVLNLPERPGPPVPEAPEDTTASTASDRVPQAELDRTRPTAKAPAGRLEEDDDEPKTKTARPQDLARTGGEGTVSSLPQRRRTGVNYAQAGEGSFDEQTRTQMADESMRSALDQDEHSESSSPTPSISEFLGRSPTPTLTPLTPSDQPPTRGGRKHSGPSVTAAPPLAPEPSTARERRKNSNPSNPKQPSGKMQASSSPPPAVEPHPPVAPPKKGGGVPLGDRDDEESTADFRLSRISKLPKLPSWLDNERTALIVAAVLLAAGIVALTGLVIQRIRQRDVAPERPPVEKLKPKQQKDPQGMVVPPTDEKMENAVADAGIAMAQHGEPEPQQKTAEQEGKDSDDEQESKTKLAPAQKTPVVFKAPAGTLIKVGKQQLVPGKQYRFAPGSLKYSYRCPKKGSRIESRTEKVPRSKSVQGIAIRCPR